MSLSVRKHPQYPGSPDYKKIAKDVLIQLVSLLKDQNEVVRTLILHVSGIYELGIVQGNIEVQPTPRGKLDEIFKCVECFAVSENSSEPYIKLLEVLLNFPDFQPIPNRVKDHIRKKWSRDVIICSVGQDSAVLSAASVQNISEPRRNLPEETTEEDHLLGQCESINASAQESSRTRGLVNGASRSTTYEQGHDGAATREDSPCVPYNSQSASSAIPLRILGSGNTFRDEGPRVHYVPSRALTSRHPIIANYDSRVPQAKSRSCSKSYCLNTLVIGIFLFVVIFLASFFGLRSTQAQPTEYHNLPVGSTTLRKEVTNTNEIINRINTTTLGTEVPNRIETTTSVAETTLEKKTTIKKETTHSIATTKKQSNYGPGLIQTSTHKPQSSTETNKVAPGPTVKIQVPKFWGCPDACWWEERTRNQLCPSKFLGDRNSNFYWDQKAWWGGRCYCC